jgi:hypothetical protein
MIRRLRGSLHEEGVTTNEVMIKSGRRWLHRMVRSPLFSFREVILERYSLTD